MSFHCPKCHDPTSLSITGRLELPADADWDEITLQTIDCHACKFAGLAVYTESRRGALDREIVRHEGYEAPLELVRRIARLVGSCSRPGDRRCECRCHRLLSEVDADGRWIRPVSHPSGKLFPMVLK